MAENDKNNEENIVAEEEILPEELEIDETEVEANVAHKIRTLRNKLTECEEERRKSLEDLQRTRADFLNSKRRLEEQAIRDRERATDKIVLELLTLMDSFDTATGDTQAWEALDERWRTGFGAIKAKLASILKSQGITEVDPHGAPFDPNEHEAVGNTPVTDEKHIDTVVTVLQKGFKRNETIIRPARVIVGTKET